MNKYKHTISLVAVSIAALMLLHFAAAIFVIGCWQLSQFAMSRKCGRCFTGALTPEQVKEFDGILKSFEGYSDMFKTLKDLGTVEGGYAAIKKLPELLKGEQKRNDDLSGDIKKLKKQIAKQSEGAGIRWVGNVPFVTNECAKALTSVFILDCQKLGALAGAIRDVSARKRAVEIAAETLGYETVVDKDTGEITTKAALTGTEIPLPTIYMPQIVELVWKFGQARQFATVYPLGAGTVKLPRLKAGEDDFGFLGVGTAGMSAAIGEKKVTAELVTFTANKAGGLIRIPTELDEDTFIQLGQFLARYIGRQLAKLEDKTVFLGDGTATYANITGVGPYCVANPTYLVSMAAGKVKPSDATIANFRKMRSQVSDAVLNSGNAAYYLKPTMEQLLVTFNTIGQPLIYRPQQGNSPATLDGFPIRWIGVGQGYAEVAAPATFLGFFGDLSYVYLGERGSVRVEVSKEVFFATDEVAMRALERIDVQLLAIDAMSALQTAAA